MEITLNSKEINKALISYITTEFNIKINANHNTVVEYKAGRGENGPTASIIIDEINSLNSEIVETIKVNESVEIPDSVLKSTDVYEFDEEIQPTSHTLILEDNNEEENEL